LGAAHPCLMRTDRLLLRPTRETDADRAFAIQSDWAVTRMIRMASFPPDECAIRRWFADHTREWQAGQAYRFAVELEGRIIGVVDLDRGSLGYWFDRSEWGRGYAYEAACAVVRFGREDAGLVKLTASHAYDNPTSGRILSKLGFRSVDVVPRFSRPRGETIMQHRYVLAFSES
jgi:[ribosomal protein S5]-alanine N-acetyltransferase